MSRNFTFELTDQHSLSVIPRGPHGAILKLGSEMAVVDLKTVDNAAWALMRWLREYQDAHREAEPREITNYCSRRGCHD